MEKDHPGWKHLNASLRDKVEILAKNPSNLYYPNVWTFAPSRLDIYPSLTEAEAAEDFEQKCAFSRLKRPSWPNPRVMSGPKYHGGMKAPRHARPDRGITSGRRRRHDPGSDKEASGQDEAGHHPHAHAVGRGFGRRASRCRTTGIESKFIHAVGPPLPYMDAGGSGWGLHAPLEAPPSSTAPLTSSRTSPSPGTHCGRHRAQRQGRLPVGDELNPTTKR